MLTTEWGTVRYPSCRDKGLVLVLVGVRPVCSTQSPLDRVATRTSTRPPPCPSSAPCPYRTSCGRQHSSRCLFNLSSTFLQIEPCLRSGWARSLHRMPLASESNQERVKNDAPPVTCYLLCLSIDGNNGTLFPEEDKRRYKMLYSSQGLMREY